MAKMFPEKLSTADKIILKKHIWINVMCFIAQLKKMRRESLYAMNESAADEKSKRIEHAETGNMTTVTVYSKD